MTKTQVQKSEKMTVWRAPSGRLHSMASCSGGAGPRRMAKVKLTQTQFDELNRSAVKKVCRCLRRSWKADAQ